MSRAPGPKGVRARLTAGSQLPALGPAPPRIKGGGAAGWRSRSAPRGRRSGVRAANDARTGPIGLHPSGGTWAIDRRELAERPGSRRRARSRRPTVGIGGARDFRRRRMPTTTRYCCASSGIVTETSIMSTATRMLLRGSFIRGRYVGIVGADPRRLACGEDRRRLIGGPRWSSIAPFDVASVMRDTTPEEARAALVGAASCPQLWTRCSTPSSPSYRRGTSDGVTARPIGRRCPCSPARRADSGDDLGSVRRRPAGRSLDAGEVPDADLPHGVSRVLHGRRIHYGRPTFRHGAVLLLHRAQERLRRSRSKEMTRAES